MKILIADDDDISRMVAAKLIKHAVPQASTQTVENGLEAAEHIQAHDALPAVMILDIHMPVMDGFQFLEWQPTAGTEVSTALWLYLRQSTFATATKRYLFLMLLPTWKNH